MFVDREGYFGRVSFVFLFYLVTIWSPLQFAKCLSLRPARAVSEKKFKYGRACRGGSLLSLPSTVLRSGYALSIAVYGLNYVF